MAFSNFICTNFGLSLEAKMKAGKKVPVSRVALGDGSIGTSSTFDVIKLKSERFSLPVSSVTYNSNEAIVTALLTNEMLEEGFNLREMGLMAIDPDTNTEGVYLYNRDSGEGEYLPDKYSSQLLKEYLRIRCKSENAANITFEFNGYPIDVTKEDLEAIEVNLAESVLEINTQLSNKANITELTDHTGNTSNPHGVTKAQVGLENVDNTSDADKPISTAMQAALDKTRAVSEGGTGLTSVTSGYFLTGNGTGDLIANAPLATMAKLGRGYTTSSTAAATTAKTASLSNFALLTGAMVAIKFTYTNTATNPTLNVNSTGAKYIYNGRTGTYAGFGDIVAGATAFFVYNGSQWILLNPASTGYNIGSLEDADWTTISEVSAMGKANTCWSIGDMKTITVNGVFYVATIIGFSHDDLTAGAKAGITFQLQTCLDTTYPMNSTSSNVGGWTSCIMRTSTMATLLTQLPSALQSVIKEVNKLTSAGSLSTTINTTIDKLFLLSEIEIFGAATNSRAGEGSQYAYYQAGNSKIKTVAGAVWRTRSPSNTGYYFCNVTANGTSTYGTADGLYGVAFAFCV